MQKCQACYGWTLRRMAFLICHQTLVIPQCLVFAFYLDEKVNNLYLSQNTK